MGIIGIVLLVVFVIICVLLVGIVLIQNEEGGGMGGLFGGAGSQAFGSRSGNVITRTTYILVTLFFVTTFGLAFLNKAPTVRPLQPEAAGTETRTEQGNWLDSPAQMTPAEPSQDAAQEPVPEAGGEAQ
jgi:preprotein translocase subunit SecG